MNYIDYRNVEILLQTYQSKFPDKYITAITFKNGKAECEFHYSQDAWLPTVTMPILEAELPGLQEELARYKCPVRVCRDRLAVQFHTDVRPGGVLTPGYYRTPVGKYYMFYANLGYGYAPQVAKGFMQECKRLLGAYVKVVIHPKDLNGKYPVECTTKDGETRKHLTFNSLEGFFDMAEQCGYTEGAITICRGPNADIRTVPSVEVIV